MGPRVVPSNASRGPSFFHALAVARHPAHRVLMQRDRIPGIYASQCRHAARGVRRSVQ